MQNKAQSPLMPEFIQGLYGVVIGVSSLRLISSVKGLLIENKSLSSTDSDAHLTIPELIFKFFFLGFTILIAAHDWYTYHKIKRAENKRHHEFWTYVPQIGSLFFLAQMVISASNNEMLPWYFWGILYTLCNFLNKQNIHDEKNQNLLRTSYYIHWGICIIAIAVLYFTRTANNMTWIDVIKNNKIDWINVTLLFLSIIIVIFIWELRENKLIWHEEYSTDTVTASGSQLSEEGRHDVSTSNSLKSIKTYKDLLGLLNKFDKKENSDRRLLIIIGAIALFASLILIVSLCIFDTQLREIGLGVFGSTSILATCATAVYLIFKSDEINARNGELTAKIEDGMNLPGTAIDEDFLKKLIEEKTESFLKETPKNPLQK